MFLPLLAVTLCLGVPEESWGRATQDPHDETTLVQQARVRGAGKEQQPSYLRGGEKRFILFMHFAGSGGTSVCDFAKSCATAPGTGVQLDLIQQVGNCNLWGGGPYDKTARNPRLTSCGGLLEQAAASPSTWGFIQTALDVTPPCPLVSFLTAMREPWSRMRSHLLKHLADTRPAILPLALEIMRRMGQNASQPLLGKHFHTNGFGNLYFNNYHVRALLGTLQGMQLPWGSLGEAHLRLAKEKLEAFDLVLPVEALSQSLLGLQCAAGERFNLSRCGLAAPPHDNSHQQDHRTLALSELAEVEQAFRTHNKLDAELYAWVLERWVARRSRCEVAISRMVQA